MRLVFGIIRMVIGGLILMGLMLVGISAFVMIPGSLVMGVYTLAFSAFLLPFWVWFALFPISYVVLVVCLKTFKFLADALYVNF